MTGRAQGRRRQGRFQTMEVSPGRWLEVRQRLRFRLGNARPRKRVGRGTAAGIEAGSKPIDYCDRHHRGDVAPSLPAVEAAQIIRAHDPDEADARTVAAQIRNGLVGVAGPDFCFQATDVDAGVACKRPGGDDALFQGGKSAGVFERIARCHQPPYSVEIEALHRQQAGAEMHLMGRIERAAEQTNAHPGAMGRQHDACRCRLTLCPFGSGLRRRKRWFHDLICPDPRTRYLKLVNCSTPTGPRAWKRPVAMPISAPNPNSPPSANCVEPLCRTIAESTSLRNFSAAARFSVTIESVWCEPKRSICLIAPSTPSTSLAEMIASRYSVDQSCSFANLTRASTARASSSP